MDVVIAVVGFLETLGIPVVTATVLSVFFYKFQQSDKRHDEQFIKSEELNQKRFSQTCENMKELEQNTRESMKELERNMYKLVYDKSCGEPWFEKRTDCENKMFGHSSAIAVLSKSFQGQELALERQNSKLEMLDHKIMLMEKTKGD